MSLYVFSGHSLSNMSNAASYAMQDYDKFMSAHPHYRIAGVNTAVHVEPFGDNFNYWYVLTVVFLVHESIGKEMHRGDIRKNGDRTEL